MHELGDNLKRRGFWDFNAGQVVVMLGLIGAFLTWWSSVGSLPSKLGDLTQAVKEMNDKGTVGERLATGQQQGAINILDSRVTRLELNFSTFNDKLGIVQTKLDVIAALLEGNKKQPK
jgi:hypothetical protein